MFFTNPGLLTFAPETVEGTAPSSGYIPLRIQVDPNWEPMNGDSVERDLVLPYQSGNDQANIRLHQTFTFRIYLGSSGTAGTAPNFAGLFPATRAAETLVTSTSATYTPAVSTSSSITLRWVIIGANGNTSLLHQMTGCRGRWKIGMNNDEFAYIEFTFMGLYSQPIDSGSLPTATFTNQAQCSPIGSSTQFTVNSVANCLQGFEFDSGNVLVFSSRAGCQPRIFISDSKPSGSIVFEQKAMAAQPVATLSTSGLTYPISLTHAAGGVGNTFAFNVAAASFGRASYTRGSDGLVLRNMPFSATGPTAWSLVLT
jgi:hypothetical protein